MSQALAALSARARRRGFEPVLEAAGRSLPAAEVFAAVERTANFLRAEGVRVLAIAADNSPDWVVVDLAARLAGIALVPLPPFFSAAQLEHVLRDSGADAIAADEFGSAALKSLPTRFAAALTPALTLLRLVRAERAPVLPAGTAKISYTSGTTGEPKGVCLRQAAMDRVALSLHDATAELGLNRHLCLLPLATLLENIAGVDAPLLASASIALPSLEDTGVRGSTGLDAGRLIRCLEDWQPESVILLPQLLAGLVAAVEQGASLPSSLRFAAVGGAVVGPALLERADRAGIPVFEGYGLTECCSVVALNTPRAHRVGSVGRPLPHCRVRIGRGAEVLVAGPSLTAYTGDDSVHRGEFATGDVGHLDEDGFLFIDGRRRNVLISSFGRNLSPEWVEAALTARPAIAQAAVFGDGMPFPVAVIVPRAASSAASVETEIAAANRNLPDYARIGHWIPAAEPFSATAGTATANGRIRRDIIARRYAAQIDACYAGPLESFA